MCLVNFAGSNWWQIFMKSTNSFEFKCVWDAVWTELCGIYLIEGLLKKNHSTCTVLLMNELEVTGAAVKPELVRIWDCVSPFPLVSSNVWTNVEVILYGIWFQLYNPENQKLFIPILPWNKWRTIRLKYNTQTRTVPPLNPWKRDVLRNQINANREELKCLRCQPHKIPGYPAHLSVLRIHNCVSGGDSAHSAINLKNGRNIT